MTKSQIDRLGARLRTGELSDADLRLLDEYRRSFVGAYHYVMRQLRDEFGLDPTGRAAKSTYAIVGKLRRESVRLSQIQDIAGCRVVVPDVPAQDRLIRALQPAFDTVSVIDRRERPSHGYRAVHLVVTVNGRTVEIQVRTTAQQLWAEISERLSDRFGIEIKYGGGHALIQMSQSMGSQAVLLIGALENEVAEMRDRVATSSAPEPIKARIDELDRGLEQSRDMLRQSIALFDRFGPTP